MNINKHVVLGACFAILTAACANNANTVAVVNGKKITKKTYEATLDNLILQQKQKQPNFMDNEQNRLVLGRIVLDQLITNEVLAQQADKAKISADEKTVTQNVNNLKQLLAVDKDGKRITDPAQIDKAFQEKLKADGITFQEFKNNIRKELNIKLFLNDLSSKNKAELNEPVLKKFYDGTMIVLSQDKNKIKTLPQADLNIIVPFASDVKKATAARAFVSAVFLAIPKNMTKEQITKKKELATKIVREIKDKKISFVEAIATYSDDKNALRTNGEQFIIQGTLPAELDKKVFTAPLGQVEGPLTQPDGIYIFRVNEKRAETPVTYKQLRGNIIQYLAAIQLQNKLQQQVKQLVAEADVKVLLPQYQVAAPQPAAK